MIKIIKKANSKLILLFLLGLFSVGVQATEWDENGVVKVYDKIEDYLKDNPCVSVQFEMTNAGTTFQSSSTGLTEYQTYLQGASDFQKSLIAGPYTGTSGYPFYRVPVQGTGYLDFDGCGESSNSNTPSGFDDSGNWDANGGGGTYYYGSTAGDSGGGSGGTTSSAPHCPEPPVCTGALILIDCKCVEKPKEPCDEARKNDARASNAVILKQNSDIKTLSTTKEYGAEQNLTSFPPAATPVFKDVPVRSGISNHFNTKFTWNATDGYTIGVCHGHPGGGGPSPADIVYAFSNLSNLDLKAGGQAAIDYYKANFALTVVTKNETFVVNVINWNELGLLYDKYHPDTLDQKVIGEAQETMIIAFQKKGQEYIDGKGEDYEGIGAYEQTIYAALKLYKDAISISKYDKKTLKYAPLVVDAMGEVKSQPCNN